MNRTISPTLALSALALSAAAVFLTAAANADDGTIYEKITPSQLARIIESVGPQASVGDDGVVTWTTDGRTGYFEMISGGTEIAFAHYIEGAKMTAADVNGWNSSKSFTTAILTTDSVPFLKMCVNLKGGVSEANIRHVLRVLDISMEVFGEELGQSAQK
jgi:hypothetical protein